MGPAHTEGQKKGYLAFGYPTGRDISSKRTPLLPPLPRTSVLVTLFCTQLIFIRGGFHGHVTVLFHRCFFLVTLILARSLDTMRLSIRLGSRSGGNRAWWSTEDRLLEIRRSSGRSSAESGWVVRATKLGQNIRGTLSIDNFLESRPC